MAKKAVTARALVETATDVASLKVAIAKIMAAKTPEAYAAVFDIAIDPPPLPLGFQVGTKIPISASAFAMGALERLHKRSPDVQELIIARCQDAPLDVDVWERPLLLLWKIARDDRVRALADERVLAGLRKSLNWADGNVAANAVDALGVLPHPPSLKPIIARLERCGADDHVLCWSVAQVLLKLGGTAADLVKLKAARARLRKKDGLVDKEIAKLEKRLRG